MSIDVGIGAELTAAGGIYLIAQAEDRSFAEAMQRPSRELRNSGRKLGGFFRQPLERDTPVEPDSRRANRLAAQLSRRLRVARVSEWLGSELE